MFEERLFSRQCSDQPGLSTYGKAATLLATAAASLPTPFVGAQIEAFSHAHKFFRRKIMGLFPNSKSPFANAFWPTGTATTAPPTAALRPVTPQTPLPRPGPRSPRRSPTLGPGPAALTQVLVVDAQVVIQLRADLGDERQVLELRELLQSPLVRHDSTPARAHPTPLPHAGRDGSGVTATGRADADHREGGGH